ncbi:TetR/AcrR family transcriptional regulator [Streptomyces marincola]|uniref:TetR/AcrR family transcriptional regulator n=1 Tax=Streptomyces marincola TaxID=2878388 RepID=UPI001CF2767D|nr:TetR/AcrR family transcriptional regulator [Streptomyces marincola]UCM87735.1 TetR/AcrR family transcriptional regulator [Streptomyces marincola]
MPRQVDHEERRRRIADAVCALADERGLEGVTLRDVAARAGVSMGAVQRCFRTKEEMLRFAIDHVGQRVVARIRARDDRDAAAGLAGAAFDVALLAEAHRAEARVWLAFLAQAAVSPPLAAVLRASYAGLHAMFARLITAAGSVAEPGREARVLLALTDGLTAHVLVGHLTPEEARAALDAHLARLTGARDAAPRGG